MNTKKKIIVPCSGIGKGFGSVTREATALITDRLHPDRYRTVCLPLFVIGDEEAVRLVRESEVVTIDGCPKRCATVGVREAGGAPVMEIMVPKVLAENPTHKPGSVLDIGEGGRLLANDIAGRILQLEEKE
ncbi:MAG: hypothetical protein HXY34_07265 [Candidatus Thorarchaeota archaeon]|nr:hypothetical protein [Candidatus Thorarchaeota archaeon]